MKPFLMFLGSLLIIVPLMMFGIDFNNAELTSDIVKHDANEAALTSVLYMDDEEYSKGRYILDDNKIIKYLDDNYSSKYVYFAYLYDENFKLRTYSSENAENKGKIVSNITANISQVNGKYTFSDARGKDVNLTDPSVVVIFVKRGDYYRLADLQEDNELVRSAMAVMDSRGSVYEAAFN